MRLRIRVGEKTITKEINPREVREGALEIGSTIYFIVK